MDWNQENISKLNEEFLCIFINIVKYVFHVVFKLEKQSHQILWARIRVGCMRHEVKDVIDPQEKNS